MSHHLSTFELDLVRLATPLENYGTLAEAIGSIADARDYQRKDWPAVRDIDAGGRQTEEWILLVSRYSRKLEDVYAESPDTPQGRARVAKYAAIVANLALSLVQSTIGTVNDEKR